MDADRSPPATADKQKPMKDSKKGKIEDGGG